MATDGDTDLLRAERDLYRRLLDLGGHDDVAPFLDEALGLAVEATAAHRGYLALYARAGDGPGSRPAFSAARGCSQSDLDAIAAQVSTGIVAEALRTGRTVSTASAVDDPRFSGQKSVQAQRIQAVLCAPVGGARGLGVLYLAGRDGAGPFPARDQALAETFAKSIAPLAERLAHAAPESRGVDHTAGARSRHRFDGLVGRSRALADVFAHVAVAAPFAATVLLLGESGTGKTEIARAIHANSRRARAPFVEINCAALPETLLEAELFGAEKGAHSTATRRSPGKIAAAEGGTLLLDEVAEIPLAAQGKLLQFLQSRRYWRLGADAPVEADVRVVAATNVDLQAAVREKRFREDLFYRLNVIVIRVPPLRERVEDIPEIAERVARQVTAENGREIGLTWAARAALEHAEWPGNVRQLAAVVQRGAAFALAAEADAIDVAHLFPDAPPAAPERDAPLTYQEATRRFQRGLLRETLEAAQWNVSEAARQLGLARSHLHELIRAHGLARAQGTRGAT